LSTAEFELVIKSSKTTMPPSSSLSLRKNYFLSNSKLDTSNGHLDKLKTSTNHFISFINKSFEEISKNNGIAFLFLDPSETHLQIFHHGTLIGGNWNSPTKQAVAVLGMDPQAKLIQIIQKSIKNVKEKSFSFKDFTVSFEDEETFTALMNPKMEFIQKNIVAIPNF
jgi:hypothetical protein